MVNIRHAVNLYLGFYLQQRHHLGDFIHIQLTGKNNPRRSFAAPIIGRKVIR
ncbi:hypothetical protein D3C80_2100930 [compost metagenome]